MGQLLWLSGQDLPRSLHSIDNLSVPRGFCQWSVPCQSLPHHQVLTEIASSPRFLAMTNGGGVIASRRRGNLGGGVPFLSCHRPGGGGNQAGTEGLDSVAFGGDEVSIGRTFELAFRLNCYFLTILFSTLRIVMRERCISTGSSDSTRAT